MTKFYCQYINNKIQEQILNYERKKKGVNELEEKPIDHSTCNKKKEQT